MLELARKLADCDASFFGGWIIAGVEAKIDGTAQRYENKLLMKKAHQSIFEVRGTTGFGTLIKKLRVFLVLPTEGAHEAKDLPNVDFPGRLLEDYSFSLEEIRDYVAYTGDQNIIHQGDNPIVPGLLLLAHLQQTLNLDRLHWRVSFLAPLYVNEVASFYIKEGQITVFGPNGPLFVIKNC